MIHADDVMPLLLAAVPSFAEQWRELEHDDLRVDDDGGPRLHYLDVGDVARHLVELQRHGNHSEVQAAFDVIETLHVTGDDYVRELATIGYLEGVQNACSHAADVDATAFESYLGPKSRAWWHGLNDFWSGQAPIVRATEEER